MRYKKERGTCSLCNTKRDKLILPEYKIKVCTYCGTADRILSESEKKRKAESGNNYLPVVNGNPSTDTVKRILKEGWSLYSYGFKKVAGFKTISAEKSVRITDRTGAANLLKWFANNLKPPADQNWNEGHYISSAQMKARTIFGLDSIYEAFGFANGRRFCVILVRNHNRKFSHGELGTVAFYPKSGKIIDLSKVKITPLEGYKEVFIAG